MCQIIHTHRQLVTVVVYADATDTGMKVGKYSDGTRWLALDQPAIGKPLAKERQQYLGKYADKVSNTELSQLIHLGTLILPPPSCYGYVLTTERADCVTRGLTGWKDGTTVGRGGVDGWTIAVERRTRTVGPLARQLLYRSRLAAP